VFKETLGSLSIFMCLWKH